MLIEIWQRWQRKGCWMRRPCPQRHGLLRSYPQKNLRPAFFSILLKSVALPHRSWVLGISPMVALKIPRRGTACISAKETVAQNATITPNTTTEALCTSNPIILGLRMDAGTSTKESSLNLAHACRPKAALFVRMSHAANARKAAL